MFGPRERVFPATVDKILLWSHTFRCGGTFCNYLGYVRSVSLALGLDCPSADHPAIRRAVVAIVKRRMFTGRPRQSIGRTLVRNMLAAVGRGWTAPEHAMLWLVAYMFLLRVPSEVMQPLSCFAMCRVSAARRSL